MEKPHFIATFFELSLMIIFWAFTPVAISYVSNTFSLLFQIWIRYISAALFFWMLIIINPSLNSQLKKVIESPVFYLRRLTLTAAFTICFQLLFTLCFSLIAPAFGVLLYQSQVLFSLLLGVLFFKDERILIRKPITILSMLGAIMGAVIVILCKDEGVTFTVSIGILMAVGAAISWSFVGVSLKKGKPLGLPPILSVSLVFSLVILLITPAVFIFDSWFLETPKLDHWLILIGSGILGIAGGQGLYYYLLPKLGLITTSSVQLLVPFITGIFSFLMFRENITIPQIFGGCILLISCYAILLQKKKLLL